MKKICLLLAMLFALSCIPALAAEGDAILGRSGDEMVGFAYCFSAGDMLYLAGYDAISTYRMGDSDLKRYEFEIPELGDESTSYDVATLPFADGGKLYALNLITEYGETAEFYGATLSELVLRDSGDAGFNVLCDVDWSSMVEYYDDSSYPIRPDTIIGMGGRAYIRYYDIEGFYRTSAIDLASGELIEIQALDNAYMIAPYKEGALLAELYGYTEGETAKLAAYNPEYDELEMLAEIEIADFSPLQALAYDAASDTIYCVKSGEICPVDLEAGAIGEGVTDMPLDIYNASPGCVLDGGYYAYGGDGAVIRNLDPAQKAGTKLKINDNFWNDAVSTAYYRFSNAHGDVSVVLSRDYAESANIIESMMNRDDSVDIYVLSTSSSEFDALYNRGYLMELDGSAKAQALAERMYPALRESFSTDGHLVALPVALSGWTLGFNEKALNAIGLTLEDVPDNWPDFLDFLALLPYMIPEDSDVRLFYSGYTAADARFDLLANIFEDYHRYLRFTDASMGYNTELMRGLLEKLDDVDFVALGCAEDEESYEDDLDYLDLSVEQVILQTGTGCSIGNFYSEFTPVLMKMEPDATERLMLDATVAIINPYTKNPEAALAFIDELAEDLSKPTLYCLDPSQSETIRGDVNQEALNEVREELKNLRAEYEKAAPADKQALEPQISEMESIEEYYDNYLWDISPRELEWYRAHDDNLAVTGYNWLYSDEAGEAMELLDQYRGGQIGISELLEGVDAKVRMMMMEGN